MDDDEDDEQPETVVSDRELSRIERRNEIARRISDAMAVLGWNATRKDIAKVAG